MRQQKIYPPYFILPALLLSIALFILPSMIGIGYGLTNGNAWSQDIHYIGFDNFAEIFQGDPRILLFIENTLLFAAVTTALKVIIGLLLALLPAGNLATRNVLRTVFYLPVVLSPLVIGLVFTSIFNTTRGLLTQSLKGLGLAGFARNWLVDTRTAMPAVMAVEVWRLSGYCMVIFLAGLKVIPASYFEAAEIDGASGLQKFFRITLPSTVVSVLFASLAAFVLSRRRTRMNTVVYYFFLLGLAAPLNMITVIRSLQLFSLMNTFQGISEGNGRIGHDGRVPAARRILPHCLSPSAAGDHHSGRHQLHERLERFHDPPLRAQQFRAVADDPRHLKLLRAEGVRREPRVCRYPHHDHARARDLRVRAEVPVVGHDGGGGEGVGHGGCVRAMIPDVARAASRSGYRVLVAEDEPRILLNIAKKIAIADPRFTVAGTAENGQEALRLARELSPDLVLTDIVMPMMDGLELIGALRVHNPTLPIAILSGYAEFEYARKAIDLGVEDYLLKPVKVEALRGLLKKVRARLEGSRRGEEKAALQAAVERGARLPSHMDFPERCAMLLLAIGNLFDASDTMPPHMRALCERCWGALDNDPALVERQRVARHWLVELGPPNQRLLVLSCGDPSEDWIRDCAERVLRALHPAARPWGACAAVWRTSRPLASAYEEAQALRAALAEGHIPGTSRVIVVGAGGSARPSPAPLLSPVEARLRALKRDGARDHVLAAVRSILQGWVRGEYPQKSIEKGLDQLVSLFEQPGAPGSAAGDARLRLHAALLAASDAALLPGSLASVFDASVLRTTLRLEARGITEAVEEHLSRCYTEPLSLVHFSRTLGFDLSYVTRVFKKHKGESPMQYLTRLRLQRARELLDESPQIDVKTIGGMVGYTDGHYFARVFRKVTGVSPSEYRGRATHQ